MMQPAGNSLTLLALGELLQSVRKSVADPDVDSKFSLVLAAACKDTENALLSSAAINQKVPHLEQRSAQLEQQGAQLEQQNAQLEQRSAQLQQRNAQLEQRNAQLEQRNAQL